MEEGEVVSGKEQKEEDSEEEEEQDKQVDKDADEEKEGVKLKEADDQCVKQEKQELDEGDMRDINMEARSSIPPAAVWAKKAV